MYVFTRGAGVAIVRDATGRFIGRVMLVGTGWQTWQNLPAPGPLVFLGWSPRRRDAVAKLG